MTKSVKAANYTAKNVELMVATYTAADSDASRKEAVAALSATLGKTLKSVIAKLSLLGVYVKAAKATKSGAVVVKKEAIVASIASSLDVDFESLKSLGKATKATLQVLADAVS
jgi:hypothetical protein